MYWVAALFDSNTEQSIKQIWKELSDESISFYEDEVKDGRPHLTIASYEDLNKDEFIDALKEFYEDKSGLDIFFNTLGSFMNYGTLFFTPTVTKDLLDFHSAHHEFFHGLKEKSNSLYHPGKWIPHCTLANNLDPETLSQAFQYCHERKGMIKGRITEIAVMELLQDNDDEGMEAPIICSIPLK